MTEAGFEDHDEDPLTELLAERLRAHLVLWLGAWPPAGELTVVTGHLRDHPGWDGAIHPIAGIATPSGTVLSVPERFVGAARNLYARTGLDGFFDGVGPLVTGIEGPLGRGVFRWSQRLPDLPSAGQWMAPDDPRVPPWLRPFNGEVLVALDAKGHYIAGVGRKRHDDIAQELAVSTEPEQQGRGLGRRLVAQAARRVVAEGGIATYLHRADNLASAAVAEAAGFPDLGWQIIGSPRAS